MKTRFISLVNRLRLRRRGLAVLLAAPLAVLAWHGVAVWREARVDRIVADLTSVMGFVGNPLPDSTGRRLIVGQQTKRGWMIYLLDTAGTSKAGYRRF